MPFEEGMRRTIEWFQENRSSDQDRPWPRADGSRSREPETIYIKPSTGLAALNLRDLWTLP